MWHADPVGRRCGSHRRPAAVSRASICTTRGSLARKRARRRWDRGARRFLSWRCGRAAGVRGSQLRCHHLHRCDKPFARSTRVLGEWHRLLKPGGRLLFTDPIVLTGPVTNREVAIRASIGLFVFVPAGLDETMLEQAGFEVERVEDRTQNMAVNAAGWLDARAKRESDLRAIEGETPSMASRGFSRPLPSSPGRSGSRAWSYWRAGRPRGCADLVAQIGSRRLASRRSPSRCRSGILRARPWWQPALMKYAALFARALRRPGHAPKTAHS